MKFRIRSLGNWLLGGTAAGVLVPLAIEAASTQVIGSFPELSGSFEDQGPGAIPVVSSIGSGATSSRWTVQTSSGTATVWSEGGRSSPCYLTFGATAARRLQSPTMQYGAVANNRPYVVQFFYRTGGAASANNGQAAMSTDGTGALSAYASLSLHGTTNLWRKVAQVVTSSAVSPKYGLAVIRFSVASGTDIDIDDLAVYPGNSADDTPPEPPAAASLANTSPGELTVRWQPPAGGIDGGGYLLVRGSSDPLAPPNPNGIYAVGQPLEPAASGTNDSVIIYIGTNTSFVDLGLDDGREYFYRLYAADKAFNYSPGVALSATTGNCLSPESVTTVAAPGTNLCAGMQVTLQATPSGGVSPYRFEWRRNGTPVAGATASSLTVPDPVDGDEFVCVVSSACGGAPASSGPLRIHQQPVLAPVVSLEAAPGTNLCAGESLVLTATTSNAGPNPGFEWKRNGVVVEATPTGTNFSQLTISAPCDSDQFECMVTADNPCASPQSIAAPPLTIHLRGVVAPQLAIAADPGTNVCAGLPLTFTASPVNGGTEPVFQWIVNGVEITGATNAIFILPEPAEGAVVACRLTPSAEVCSTTPSTIAEPLTIHLIPVSTPTLTIEAVPAADLCAGEGLTLKAVAQNAGSNPSFQWTKNDAPFGPDGIICTDPAPADGDRYECRLTTAAQCASPNMVEAGPVIVTLHSFGTAGPPAVVFAENFGNPRAATSVSNYTGWQNGAPIVYATSTATDVRGTGASSGYAGASGGGNVFMGSAGALFRDFVVQGIDGSGFSGLALEFGLRIDTAPVSLRVETSAGGGVWTPLGIAESAAMGTWTWITATGRIASARNLCFRFTKDGSGQVRIDDVRLTGLPMTEAAAQITASAPGPIRAGEWVTLTASPGVRWEWGSGETTQVITVQPLVTSVYTVTVTDARGCLGSAELEVAVTSAPVLRGGAWLDAATGELVARFVTAPGGGCTVESADGPGGPWTAAGTGWADAEGVFELRVGTAEGERKFYRIR